MVTGAWVGDNFKDLAGGIVLPRPGSRRVGGIHDPLPGSDAVPENQKADAVEPPFIPKTSVISLGMPSDTQGVPFRGPENIDAVKSDCPALRILKESGARVAGGEKKRGMRARMKGFPP